MLKILLRDKKRFAIYVFACSIFVTSFLLFNLIISLIAGVAQTRNLDELIKYSLYGILVMIYTATIFLISRFLRLKFMRDTILYIREQAFETILVKSYRSFERKLKSEYISNLVNDINTFEDQFFLGLINIINNSAIYFFSLGILFFMEMKLAIIMLFVSVAVFFINRSFQGKTVRMQEAVQKNNEKYTVDVANTFYGLEILKLNRIEEKFLMESMGKIDNLERKKYNFFAFTFWQRKFSEFIGTIAILGIIFYASGLFAMGYSMAMIMFMIQLANSTIWPITETMPLFNNVKANSVIIENIIKCDESKDLPAGNKEFSFEDSIKIKNLSFSHGDKKILDNVSLEIINGKKYLVRGVSGSGKTTLIQLLTKIYDDYEGEILIDSTDLKDIREESFNSNISFIYQDVFLLKDTIRNNITLYKNYTDEEIYAASSAAGLDDFLYSKTDGLDSLADENAKNMSGGERQRISIARSMIRKPEILFTDEITSALDNDLGMQIEKTILNLPVTVISISHKFYPEVSEGYDYVIAINAGKVSVKPMKEYLEESGI